MSLRPVLCPCHYALRPGMKSQDGCVVVLWTSWLQPWLPFFLRTERSCCSWRLHRGLEYLLLSPLRCSSLFPFYSVNKYLTSTYCLPGSVLGMSKSLAGGGRREEVHSSPGLREDHFCPEHQGRLLGVGGSLGAGRLDHLRLRNDVQLQF